MALTLKVLLENRRAAGADPLLQAKAGLSLLIEDETTSILPAPTTAFCAMRR